MHIPRFLAVTLAAAFVLTLLFAAEVGAQEDSTDTEAGGTQAVEVQQQVGAAAAPAPPSGPLAGAKVIVSGGDTGDTIENGDTLRINGDYDVEPGTSITIEDEAGTQGTFVDGRNAKITATAEGIKIEVTGKPIGVVETGTATDETLSEKGRVEAVASDGVRKAGANQGGGSGGDGSGSGGGDGGGGDSGNNPVDVAQQNTVPETTTSNLNTANPNTTAADANLNANTNRPNSGSFRCEFFLRTVTDDQGALRDQYRGNEQIVQRFEQCLSEDVLANTIPDRNLPFTGGMSLLFLGAIGLAAVVAGAAVLRAVMRRAG